MKMILLTGAALSLLSASAFAADLEPEMAFKTPPVPPPFTWSGCYAGVQAGGGFGQTGLTDSAGLLAPLTGFTAANVAMSGYTLGGQIGCDYQFAPSWLVGIEGAAAGGNIAGNSSFALPGLPGDSARFKETTDLLTSVTGRVGYTWDHWLLYAKGGGAWAGNRYSAYDTLATYDYEGVETRFGWTAGVGVEWALWNDWSLKLEYDYYGFGTHNVTFIDSISGNTGPENISQNIQVIKLGLNFHVAASAAPVVPLGW